MEHVLIFLGHTSVPVISGPRASTVRLISMNVAAGTVVVSIWARVFALMSMHPASVVMTQIAKDFNVTVHLALKVFRKKFECGQWLKTSSILPRFFNIAVYAHSA